MLNKLNKNLIITIAAATVILFLFGVLSDFTSIINSFAKFNWLLLPVLLLLSLGNYVVRFFKWDYYLKLLKIKVTTSQSVKVFFSGLSMSASPGKMGEVLKSILLKEMINEPISKTAPIIFAERVTDFLSLIFVTILVGFFYDYSGFIVYVVLIFYIVLILIVSNRPLAENLILLISRIHFIEPHVEKIKTIYESSYILLKPKPLFKMFVISIFSWFFECFGFYLILINFDLHVSVFFPTFVFALSIVLGAASMLPGGLGVTEGSLSLLLINSGVANDTAVASTIILRVVTLWFAVLLGFVVLTFLRREIRQSSLGK